MRCNKNSKKHNNTIIIDNRHVMKATVISNGKQCCDIIRLKKTKSGELICFLQNMLEPGTFFVQEREREREREKKLNLSL